MRRTAAAVAACLGALALLAAPASAETQAFVNLNGNAPSLGAGTEGPGSRYPWTVPVAGVGGTVTDVNVAIVGLGSSFPDDLDMALVGPNGAQVMLMSDACGANPFPERRFWTFDDEEQTFLSNNGPCPTLERGGFKPSNYVGTEAGEPEEDALDVNGGPAPPYTNSLAVFDGASTDGNWNLFLLDDNGNHGLAFAAFAWALELEFNPPPPPAPPAPVIIRVPAAPVIPAATGQRARALAKCKSKPTQKAKKKCKAKAKALPV